MFEKLVKLENVFQDLVPDFKMKEAIVYGELIGKGTATNKEDVFHYRSKGIEAGDIVVFGAGLVFPVMPHEQLDHCVSHLRQLGFHIDRVNQDNDDCQDDSALPLTSKITVFMNDVLAKKLNQCGFEQLAKQQKVRFLDLAEMHIEKLLLGEVEGIVINFEDEILKWVGSSCVYADYHLKEMEQIKNSVDNKMFTSFEQVADQSRKNKMKNRKRNPVDNLLEGAYISALTKMVSIKEHLENGGNLEQYRKELQEDDE